MTEKPSGGEIVEILPGNIGGLPSTEAAPLLTRAASRIDIVKPKSEFWNGMQQNLKGAAGWIEARGAKFKGKTLNMIAGVSLVTTMAAACAKPPETPYIPTQAPRITDVIPTEMPLPTETSEPTPTEAARFQLEDGTQLERAEQGQLVELFPGSEVFMSERGDVVIINEETGLQLAGQEVETAYGRITLLIGDTLYQSLVESSFGRETSLGGYPNIVDSPHRDEMMRIMATLIAIKNGEIGLGGNFESYQPEPKNFVMIYMTPGNAIRLANSMEEGLIDPDNVRAISNYEVGYPTLEIIDNTFLFIRFFGAVGQLPEDYPEDAKQLSLYEGLSYTLTNPLYRLVLEAAVAQGYDHIEFANNYTNKGFEGLMQSPFGSLFANPGIKTWMSQEREHISVTLEKLKHVIPSVIEVDFADFQ